MTRTRLGAHPPKSFRGILICACTNHRSLRACEPSMAKEVSEKGIQRLVARQTRRRSFAIRLHARRRQRPACTRGSSCAASPHLAACPRCEGTHVGWSQGLAGEREHGWPRPSRAQNEAPGIPPSGSRKSDEIRLKSLGAHARFTMEAVGPRALLSPAAEDACESLRSRYARYRKRKWPPITLVNQAKAR